MATVQEFEAAFDDPGTWVIIVRSRGGKTYYLHRDQLPHIRDGMMVYGTVIKPHPRDTVPYRWFDFANLEIVQERNRI